MNRWSEFGIRFSDDRTKNGEIPEIIFAGLKIGELNEKESCENIRSKGL